jgi:hypothetical protein
MLERESFWLLALSQLKAKSQEKTGSGLLASQLTAYGLWLKV